MSVQVSSDYLDYQILEACQAFCSSITGTLAQKAVLQGVGVGNATATATSAVVTYLTRDMLGARSYVACPGPVLAVFLTDFHGLGVGRHGQPHPVCMVPGVGP